MDGQGTTEHSYRVQVIPHRYTLRGKVQPLQYSAIPDHQYLNPGVRLSATSGVCRYYKSSDVTHLASIQAFRLSFCCTGTAKQHCKITTKTNPSPEGGAFSRIFGAIYFMSELS